MQNSVFQVTGVFHSKKKQNKNKGRCSNTPYRSQLTTRTKHRQCGKNKDYVNHQYILGKTMTEKKKLETTQGKTR